MIRSLTSQDIKHSIASALIRMEWLFPSPRFTSNPEKCWLLIVHIDKWETTAIWEHKSTGTKHSWWPYKEFWICNYSEKSYSNSKCGVHCLPFMWEMPRITVREKVFSADSVTKDLDGARRQFWNNVASDRRQKCSESPYDCYTYSSSAHAFWDFEEILVIIRCSVPAWTRSISFYQQ